MLLFLLFDPLSPIDDRVGVGSLTGVTREGEGTIGVSSLESIGSVICRTNSSLGLFGLGDEVG